MSRTWDHWGCGRYHSQLQITGGDIYRKLCPTIYQTRHWPCEPSSAIDPLQFPCELDTQYTPAIPALGNLRQEDYKLLAGDVAC